MAKSKVKDLFTTLMEKYFRGDLRMIRKFSVFKLSLKSMKFTLVSLRKGSDMVLAC